MNIEIQRIDENGEEIIKRKFTLNAKLNEDLYAVFYGNWSEAEAKAKLASIDLWEWPSVMIQSENK